MARYFNITYKAAKDDFSLVPTSSCTSDKNWTLSLHKKKRRRPMLRTASFPNLTVVSSRVKMYECPQPMACCHCGPWETLQAKAKKRILMADEWKAARYCPVQECLADAWPAFSRRGMMTGDGRGGGAVAWPSAQFRPSAGRAGRARAAGCLGRTAACHSHGWAAAWWACTQLHRLSRS